MAERQLTPFIVTGGPVPPEDVMDREAYLKSIVARMRVREVSQNLT
ncbi:MAG TPA: hypothetical protein VHL09_08010 [Dehalococcoidia bacterium]|nr:hypothetical protein [Dehalococcoidia bacterium]